MPIIGPIIGAIARAAATRGASVSASQFARGASGGIIKGGMRGKGNLGAMGRGALLMSAFSGTSGSSSNGLSSTPEQTSGSSQKQGLDTYGDGIY